MKAFRRFGNDKKSAMQTFSIQKAPVLFLHAPDRAVTGAFFICYAVVVDNTDLF
jgi:hypothetical protein